ncbi:protein of unknown function DUF101 [Ferroglobus placidus DSM 10642]|uniref:Protein archease n=1 Tax=Ferroglobus placidus (strain DSM 10642 / AEDII12DO) TaxID=589924 RepID=D3S2W0_FERPA|nr:archease [Ferroglobus placidus]ADC66672.1 protein of unknown function DUF101 [Ferroglobus placidus DSM 10642]
MYRFVEHTADIAFEVEAESLEELFIDAANAFYEAFCNRDLVKEEEERRLELEEEDVEHLLYSWLNEILFLFDAEHFAAKRVEVSVENNSLKARLIGGKITPEAVKLEPKAITMHKFRVERKDGKFYAFVIIDI